MYGEAGRGRGQGQRRGQGGGDWKNQKSRLQMAQEEDALEATLGYANFSEGEDRLGWLMNVCAVRHRPPRTAGAPRTRANAKADGIARSREPRTREREREAPRDRPSSFLAPGARPSFQIFRARPREGRGGALATASATARARAVVPPIDRILGQSRNLRGAFVAREAGRPPTLPRSRPRSRRSRRSIHHDPPGFVRSSSRRGQSFK